MIKMYPQNRISLLAFIIATLLLIYITACDSIKNLTSDPGENTVVQTTWEGAQVLPEESPVVSTNFSAVVTERRIQEIPLPTQEENLLNAGMVESSMKRAHYAVQIGSFQKKSNATRLVAVMKKKNYPAEMIIVNSGKITWHAVRFGKYKNEKTAIQAAKTYSNKENADAAIVIDNSFKGMVNVSVPLKRTQVLKQAKSILKNKIATKKTPKKAIINFKKDLPYSFQVGGLLTSREAKSQLKKLKKNGYQSFLLKVRDTATNEEWSTIQIGYYGSLLSAANAALAFSENEDLPTRARHIKNVHKNF